MKILITGASSGLGEELARQYAAPNVELILLARRKEKLQTLQKELQNHCLSVKIIALDITNFIEVQKEMQALGAVDILILNAGISLAHSKKITPLSDFKRLFDINLFANHAILEVMLPFLIAQKSGKIVFISSMASLFSMPSASAYATSKRALNAYAEALMYTYKKDGIEVINILPGFIKSELTDKNNFKMPFLLSTQAGVKRIKCAIDTSKSFYVFPLRFYLIISLFKLLPQFLRQRIVNSAN